MEKIEKEKAELEKLREDVTEKAQAQKREEEERLYNLAKIYEGVDPVQLAVVMANMDDSLVVAILQKMKSQKAGKILESMPVERAAKISSKLLAGENR